MEYSLVVTSIYYRNCYMITQIIFIQIVPVCIVFLRSAVKIHFLRYLFFHLLWCQHCLCVYMCLNKSVIQSTFEVRWSWARCHASICWEMCHIEKPDKTNPCYNRHMNFFFTQILALSHQHTWAWLPWRCINCFCPLIVSVWKFIEVTVRICVVNTTKKLCEVYIQQSFFV